MKTEEAKKILLFYRPGSADERDPAFAEALALARAAADASGAPEEELAAWFKEHCTHAAAGRMAFQSLSAPRGFKEQILAERPIALFPPQPKPRPVWPLLAMAAAVVALLSLIPILMRQGSSPDNLTACRNRMVRMALSPYLMDLESTNQERVRAFLAEKSAPANYALPAHIASAQLIGCGIKSWNNTPVSMICFRSGRALRKGAGSDLWLFVIDNAALSGVQAPSSPAYDKVSRAMAATWTANHRTYILVGDGDKSFLARYLD